MNSAVLKMWLRTAAFAVCVYLFALLYMWLYWGSFRVVSLSEGTAFTGGVLIGLSFALSGLCYFLDAFDSKLQYRKYLGLLGYYFALIYSVSLALRFPDRYITNFSTTIIELEAILGIVAMAILTAMTVISQNYWMKKFGKHWRPLLRFGYLAYALLVIRAVIVEQDIWNAWLAQPEGLPPARMVLSIFAVCVIALRVSMESSLLLTPAKTAA